MEQQEKINTFNQEILQGLETAEVTDDAIQREHDRINTNYFKVGSFIQKLEMHSKDFIEKIETAVADTDDADDRSSTHSGSRNVSL